jgi:hypothetical protein
MVSAKHLWFGISNPDVVNPNSHQVGDMVYATETSYITSSPATAIATLKVTLQPYLLGIYQVSLRNHHCPLALHAFLVTLVSLLSLLT